ncbi:MAG TPA: AarF/ABC1/UbiB kinase family protein [Blastocatellia bacterium]|nr:AarF/ABC1/UbiB kinase family protein [Blastocatellia bacterium]
MSDLTRYSNGANNGNGTNGLTSPNSTLARPQLVNGNLKSVDLTVQPPPRFGWKGVVRTVQILYFLVGFLLYVWADFRGWLGKNEEKKEAIFRRHAIKLRNRLLKLGPTFIKIGQTLATRADLIPIQYVDELSILQDRVPAVPNDVAFAIFKEELGQEPTEVFADITLEPIAAASLGQVYRARLVTGQEVAVKIQRPNLHQIISFDLHVLKKIASFLDRYKIVRGQEWCDMMDEFDRTVHEEMDYVAEGRNAERFKANFAEWKDVHVPTIYWQHTTKRVLVMEFIHGLKVIDLDGIRAAGFSAQKINELMVRTYFKQLLEDGFFHADPHPGNLRVMKDGRLAFFDFGMVGTISEKLQSQMVSAFFHLLEQDANGLVDDMISLNFLSPNADLEGFRKVVSDMFSRTLSLRLKEIRFKEITYELAPIVYKYPLTTPGHFTYIIRAMMTLEGISIRMNPEFNFLEVAGPYARDFLFRKESALLRKQVWQSLQDAKSGQINWSRMWSLAKMAFSLYFQRA